MSSVFGNMAQTLTRKKHSLSDCQFKIIHALANGTSINGYANECGISKRTVEAHLAQARKFYDVDTTYQLICVCTKAGIV
ncbi:Transcription regulator LuxR, C-terminal [uncultured Caudovirales phage]|uniref:Transcription regulator LuxR, C-terminal n=1 Tax=uncultured Caudovirales phage TaxID=2100421 RepID=A0A6J5N2S1_9CAUD|nr:Transcription regulator LuxR, C-terminal [uncultured Caudovirales phage]